MIVSIAGIYNGQFTLTQFDKVIVPVSTEKFYPCVNITQPVAPMIIPMK